MLTLNRVLPGQALVVVRTLAYFAEPESVPVVIEEGKSANVSVAVRPVTWLSVAARSPNDPLAEVTLRRADGNLTYTLNRVADFSYSPKEMRWLIFGDGWMKVRGVEEGAWIVSAKIRRGKMWSQQTDLKAGVAVRPIAEFKP